MRWTRLSHHGLLLASCRHWHRRWFVELLRSRLMLWLKSLSAGHRHYGHLIRHLALHLLSHWRELALRWRSLRVHILVVGGIERWCLLLIDLLAWLVSSLVVVSATHVVTTAIVLLPAHLVVILATVIVPWLLLLVWWLHHGVVWPAVSASCTHRHTCRRWHIVLHVGVVRLEGVVHVVVHRRGLLGCSRRGFELCDVLRHLERRLEVSHGWVQRSSVCRCRLRCLVATENTQKQYIINTLEEVGHEERN